MSYTRINWQNSPSISTPLGAANLNKMDAAIYTHESNIATLSNTKANLSDLQQALKSVTYNNYTGVFTFTWFNGSIRTVDLNVEKIPVSFTMSDDGVITMINADGTYYTADIGTLLHPFDFQTSSTIQPTKTVLPDGTEQYTFELINGSVTADKLQPDYLADITEQSTYAQDAAILAQSYAKGGTGTRENEDFDNAEYYKNQARAIVGAHGHTIVDSNGHIYPNRMSFIFESATIVDDETNDATHISTSSTVTDADWEIIQDILDIYDNTQI